MKKLIVITLVAVAMLFVLWGCNGATETIPTPTTTAPEVTTTQPDDNLEPYYNETFSYYDEDGLPLISIEMHHSVGQTEEEKQLQRELAELFSELLLALRRQDHAAIQGMTSPELFSQIIGNNHWSSAVYGYENSFHIIFHVSSHVRSFLENEIVHSVEIFLSNAFAHPYVIFEMQNDEENSLIIHRAVELISWRQAQSYGMMFDEFLSAYAEQLHEAGLYQVSQEE